MIFLFGNFHFFREDEVPRLVRGDLPNLNVVGLFCSLLFGFRAPDSTKKSIYPRRHVCLHIHVVMSVCTSARRLFAILSVLQIFGSPSHLCILFYHGVPFPFHGDHLCSDGEIKPHGARPSSIGPC